MISGASRKLGSSIEWKRLGASGGTRAPLQVLHLQAFKERVVTHRSWVVLAVSAAVLVGAAAYGLSPFLAVKSLKDAARSGDRDRLEEFVDFPTVRENLKSQIAAGLMKSISTDPQMSGNPFAAAGALLVPAITDRMVNSIVTPDGIALVLSQGKVSRADREPDSESTNRKASSNIETVLSYRTLNRFHADLRRRDQPETTLALTLERRGLFAWKLIRIDVPQSLFNAAPPPSALSAPNTGSIPTVESAGPAVPSDESAASSSSGSDLCRMVALVRVPSIEDPESAMSPGETHDSVTQYNVSKKTGAGTFCTHGGYCYPRFVSIAGKTTEALQLQNCRIGRKASEDADETSYRVDLDRSKVSKADLTYNDVTNTLLNMGLCSACAGNAAQHYVQRPASECGRLVKSALEGDPASKVQLMEFPEYCKWRD